MTDERRCGACRDIKPASAYYSAREDICRSCTVGAARERTPDSQKVKSRTKHLKKNYGLTPDQVVTMLERQQGKCAICRAEMTPPGNEPTSMCVEHSHVTNRVRGLACQSCNKVIGFARDNTEVLRAAIRYLDEHTERERVRQASWR